ncbi:hypothetical protein MmiHf6_16460 [Methanimicrococcus hongohii]|uniref:HNH nuclease domain-containing protein n=1 Tax=Methanimicrococcus hongohii TaxID=3028295 RepID=A0AA96V2T6_9EURY|nr:hypothetical protein [Methanimicrococcus sp. Hf6]WNY24315.1 hypothetical protein MmiHf6_16460 [Methanimicrococcus sp. Hf6]
MSFFDQYYSEYMNTQEGFDKFHNEVINMPRDHFSDMNLNKIQSLSAYLLLTENKINSGFNYKELMFCIHSILPELDTLKPVFRDFDMEKRYFDFSDSDINDHYNKEGRMFRHLMFLSEFFGMIYESNGFKCINYNKCREYYTTERALLIPVIRNNLILMNINTNSFFKSLKSIDVSADADYRPAYLILKYMSEINRSVTKFELSILFGRIDSLQKDSEILGRALNIGRTLPSSEGDQKSFFFKKMGWEREGRLFAYRSSQSPTFKFKSFILYLDCFGLIEYNQTLDIYNLTDYSKKILDDDISYLVADLENLLSIIDNYSGGNNELNDLILHQRNPELLKLAQDNPDFEMKMNLRSINNPMVDSGGKRRRNRLIAELAKIKAQYMCQYLQKHIFKMSDGRHYCEAHHIIEFSTENGPDITLNLLVLGPEAHMLLHHACKDEKDEVYLQLVKNNILNFDRFKDMIVVYRCLTLDHIEILHHKKIITNKEKEELIRLT